MDINEQNLSDFIEKKKVNDLYLSDEVVVDVNCSALQHITIPFVDYDISCNSQISVVNFTNNNVIATYTPVYGEIPPEGYIVKSVIPAFPDKFKKFNEFYINFIVLDDLKLSISFYVIVDGYYKIENLPEVISSNYTFHFYEDNDGNYNVDWKQNYDSAVSGLIQPI